MAKLRIRKYPHFDGDLSLPEAKLLVNDAAAVGTHPFFPFIESAKHWTKFAVKGTAGASKDRPIRYAARGDACIYAHYRELLMPLYEAKLKSLGIEQCVLAYRRVPKVGAAGNKSNIDFAHDVFEKIIELGDCYAYALDIKGFFENIDHTKLKSVWAELLGTKGLPKDHHNVFKNVTRFAWVEKEALYKLLGYIGPKKRPNGKVADGYLKRVPLQVCNGKTFRNKVSALIQENKVGHGIPQGSPISDVLANMYLLDFDAKMVAALASCGGYYFRYSDDILMLVPGAQDDIDLRLKLVQDTLNSCGDELIISSKKSAVHKFERLEGSDHASICTLVYGSQGKNGLEYLGFRFDGKHVFIRDSTRAGLNRKIVAAANKLARIHVDSNPKMSVSQLEDSFNYNRVITKFGRVDNFESNTKGYRGWTFWTYAVRANATFGPKGKPILRQMRNYKLFVRRKCKAALLRFASLP